MKQESNKKNVAQVSFLRFSRTQRRAILFITVLATAGMLVFKSGVLVKEDEKAGQPFVAAKVSRELVARDTNNYSTPHIPTYTHTTYPNRKTAPETSFQSGAITHFDPNHVTFKQLIEMGLREKAARNLVNYRSKGGRFHKPEDLGKLYGLRPGEVEKLISYVKFEHETQKDLVNESPTPETEPATTLTPPAKTRPFQMVVDVNLADSLTWTMLPGIGAKRASAILRFRSKLGGFASIDQVAETYGLPDSVFQKIKANLTYTSTPMQQLSLNAASEAQLKSHPYINWQIAKLIVAYRDQHGPYQQVDDLLKIHAIEKDWFTRVRPYLKAGSSEENHLVAK